MNMTELREAFAYFRDGNRDSFTTEEIVKALADPTTITEAGLRELGFVFDDYTKLWEIGEDGGFYSQSSAMLYCHGLRAKNVKNLGQLRLLLLSVGE